MHGSLEYSARKRLHGERKKATAELYYNSHRIRKGVRWIVLTKSPIYFQFVKTQKKEIRKKAIKICNLVNMKFCTILNRNKVYLCIINLKSSNANYKVYYAHILRLTHILKSLLG